MAQAKQYMGSGSVKKLMLQLMIPAVVAQVVNLLYNIVDRIYIGHIAGIGAAALTGVGLFTPILMLLNAFAMLVGAGGAPRTAIALGQGDKEQAEKIISNSFTMLLLFSVVLTVVFYAGAPTLLRLFGASDATLPYALSYSRIYILGSVFVLLVLGMNPFITTQGFAKTSMLTTVIGAVINIILDPILIFGLGLGVQGAAIATVLSQAVGAVWILHFLTGKKTILRLRKDCMRPEKKVILPVMALGISTFVMMSTESLLSISFSSSLARYGGDVAVGAMTVITSASQLCTLPIQGICQGGQPVMSFNFGAGKKPRVNDATSGRGGGIGFGNKGSSEVVNCIVVDNVARPESTPAGSNIFLGPESTAEITYTIWPESEGGVGNLNAEPQFVDGTYMLQSSSPAINAGNN